jgi:hypothetical protein
MHQRLLTLLMVFVMLWVNTAALYAQNRDTGVYVNKREINGQDRDLLESLLGPLAAGHYWLDQNFNFGREGDSCWVNLARLSNGATNPCYYGDTQDLPPKEDTFDEAVEQVRQQLNGQRVLVSWRDGGVVYGTYYFQEIEYCNSAYRLVGQSEKHTVEDNIQRNSWQEEGAWQVMRYQDQIVIHYRPLGGEEYFVPVNISTDGTIIILWNGVSTTPRGKASCG